ncbi:MAG: hypothetical protein ACD_47C00018G0003 [uncultured bacterium]|nr:MAG: hypothetical protein ACD_47C00018G0003 [uncultured bacterium]
MLRPLKFSVRSAFFAIASKTDPLSESESKYTSQVLLAALFMVLPGAALKETFFIDMYEKRSEAR